MYAFYVRKFVIIKQGVLSEKCVLMTSLASLVVVFLHMQGVKSRIMIHFDG